MLRLLLGDFLDKHRISVEKLADTISENLIADEKAVSERYLRYLKSNREPLTASNQNRKPSLLMLGLIIRALRVLTQKSVTISDILEYSDNTTLLLPKNQLFEQKDSDSQYSYTLIRKNKRSDFDLDDLWELVVQTLESKNHFTLSQVVKEASNSQSNSRSSKKPLTFPRQVIAMTLLVLLTTGAYYTYDQMIANPRLLARYSKLFSFRDRVRPTSDIPVPSLIGPEADISQLTPTLRISPVKEAKAYEFYIENMVSNDGVYTGPVTSTTFVIPENSLCPNTSYEWRARALGEDGWTSFSSPMHFRVLEQAALQERRELIDLSAIHTRPDSPEIISPIGSTNTLTPQLELSELPNVLGFGFYIRDLRTDALVYDDNFSINNSLQLPEGILEDGGVYQWNARIRNCHYWSEFTPAQVFTVNLNER